jgi:hypothetical protein
VSQKNYRKCTKTLESKVFFELSLLIPLVFLQKKTFWQTVWIGASKQQSKDTCCKNFTYTILLALCYYDDKILLWLAPLKNATRLTMKEARSWVTCS